MPASLISDPYFLDIPWWTNNFNSDSQFNFTVSGGGTNDSNGWYFDDNYGGNAGTMQVTRCITLSPGLVGGNRKHIYSSLIPAPPVSSAIRLKARFIPDANQWVRVDLRYLSHSFAVTGYTRLQCYKAGTNSNGNYEVIQSFPTGGSISGVSELVSTRVWDNNAGAWRDGIPPGTKYMQVLIYNQGNGIEGSDGNLASYCSVSNIGVDLASSTEMLPKYAATRGYASQSGPGSEYSAANTITVPINASLLLIQAYLGDAYFDSTAAKGGTTYFSNVVGGSLYINGTLTTTQKGTLIWSVADPTPGTYPILVTRDANSGNLRLAILVTNR